MDKKFAVLDIGSNTFHFIIAEIDRDEKLRVIFRNRVILRLGNYHSRSKNIIPVEKFNAAVAVIEKCKKAALAFNIPVLITATSAVREAENREEFLQKIKAETGLVIRLLSGDEEAEFVFTAISRKLRQIPVPLIALDIGGGSTEIIRGKEGILSEKTSLKLGTVRMKELFFTRGNSLETAVAHTKDYVSATLKAAGINKQSTDGTEICAGSSGGIKTAVELASGFKKPSFFMELLKAKRSDIENLMGEALACGSVHGIADHFDIEHTKADILLPCLVILTQTLKALNMKEVLYSDYGLREGIIFSQLETALGKE
jgi:exopolyphosphatase/guanosine-5'-triphosphate,3'-diphosphate pyrophosphatase